MALDVGPRAAGRPSISKFCTGPRERSRPAPGHRPGTTQARQPGSGRWMQGSGAARGIRTPDPLITNEVLYQLSYCGVWATRVDDERRRRPRPCGWQGDRHRLASAPGKGSRSRPTALTPRIDHAADRLAEQPEARALALGVVRAGVVGRVRHRKHHRRRFHVGVPEPFGLVPGRHGCGSSSGLRARRLDGLGGWGRRGVSAGGGSLAAATAARRHLARPGEPRLLDRHRRCLRFQDLHRLDGGGDDAAARPLGRRDRRGRRREPAGSARRGRPAAPPSRRRRACRSRARRAPSGPRRRRRRSRPDRGGARAARASHSRPRPVVPCSACSRSAMRRQCAWSAARR